MSTTLIRGGRFNLTTEAANLQKLGIGLGWKVPRNGQSYEVDASIFMLGENSKIPEEKYFVFYNNLLSKDESVRHLSYNKPEFGAKDEQTIFVDLSKINSQIQELLIVVTIHEAKEKRQNFSQIQNIYIRLYDQTTGQEFARYNLEEDFSKERAVEFGKLYRRNQEWRFQAVGAGYNAGLQRFVDQYYVENATSPHQTVASIATPAEFNITPVRLLANQLDPIFTQKGLSNRKARVGIAIELSNLTKPLCHNGNLHQILERILAIATRLNIPTEVDIWGFRETFLRLDALTEANLEGYIHQQLLTKFDQIGNSGSLNLAPVMVDIFQKYLKEKPRNYPSFVIFLSTGNCEDSQRAELVLKSASKYAIFWQFIGLAADLTSSASLLSRNFELLQQLDTLVDRKLDNAGFIEMNHLSLNDEQEFFSKLLTEFPYWLIDAQAQNII